MTERIKTALMRDGYLAFTGSALQCVGDALARWSDFTALPIDVRQQYHQKVSDGEARGGWSLMREHPVYTSHMSQAELESAEPKQEFGFSVVTGRTLWPDEAVAPGFAENARAAVTLLDGVAQALLGVFEQVLGQDAGFLKYEPGYVALKHYPGQPTGEGGARDAGLHEHSDAVVFTMFSQSVESLQIRGRDGRWINVPADPAERLVVAPGDWTEIFTNGAIPAVRHRVMDTEVSRTSLAFFQGVAPMGIGPLAQFVGEGGKPGYPKVQSDIDYVGGESGVPRWKTAVAVTPVLAV
ncbi:MAG: 2OG-Fe(II) oxygenase family protein [Alphaproteobacteria bacterium]|nr:hypothetical protein [Rhodospirillaceae bacterium]MDG2479327.1 2OG-Fe(II) oxygenase family protein [Alphaproteobacteria bacterium]MBT6205621.1 hypothetical protein [Rhodospirillaceae bacterium]MBT6512710.1 hypothetical protein [Rhodospirillaceae bacterium]MBT7615047.1 hypothetical protein [Rhodospirillaceae bacterium]